MADLPIPEWLRPGWLSPVTLHEDALVSTQC